MISFLFAMGKNRVIGKDNDLPWHIPEDWAYFKKITTDRMIIMGRKTYESLGNQPLPNRTNIVVTTNPDFRAEGCMVVHSVDEARQYFDSDEEIFVIGGAKIFEAFYPYADRLYVTYIDQTFEGDTFVQEINDGEWKEISNEKGLKNKKNPYDYYFQIYERR